LELGDGEGQSKVFAKELTEGAAQSGGNIQRG
jgi:hypothetical protein